MRLKFVIESDDENEAAPVVKKKESLAVKAAPMTLPTPAPEKTYHGVSIRPKQAAVMKRPREDPTVDDGADKNLALALKAVLKEPRIVITKNEAEAKPMKEATEKIGHVNKGKKANGWQATIKCHQCKKNEKEKLVRCNDCKRGFCVGCLKWYPYLAANQIEEKCPVCRGNCNCTPCLRDKSLNKVEKPKCAKDVEGKKSHSLFMLQSLLPHLKQIFKAQKAEIEMEEKAKGWKVKVKHVAVRYDERVYCDICKKSILDMHRRCSACPVEVCLSCCVEVRQNNVRALGSSLVVQYLDRGPDYPHGGLAKIKNRRLQVPVKLHAVDNWKARADGSIPCPSKDLDGCGNGLLELKCFHPPTWIPDLIIRAEKILDEVASSQEMNGGKPSRVDGVCKLCDHNSSR